MFKHGDSSSRQKIDGCFFQKIQNVIWFLSFSLPRRDFTLKPIKRPYVPLKNSTRYS